MAYFPDWNTVNKKDIDKEILIHAILAEIEAISLYRRFAAMTNNPKVRKLFLDIANEEKVHIGEFMNAMFRFDKEFKPALEKGKKESDKLLKAAELLRMLKY